MVIYVALTRYNHACSPRPSTLQYILSSVATLQPSLPPSPDVISLVCETSDINFDLRLIGSKVGISTRNR